MVGFYVKTITHSGGPSATFEMNERSSTDIEVLQDIFSRELDALDPRLLEFVRRRLLYAPSRKPRNLKRPNTLDYSPRAQSRVVDTFLHQRRNGFFVEAGAWDGEKTSNSLFFEKSRNWTGILIEPDPQNFEQLVMKNRKAFVVQSCLTSKPIWLDFTLSSRPDAGAINPINKNRPIRGKTRLLCLPIQTLLSIIGRTHVDFFSLDIEGAELEVLRAFPWDKITVDMWTVEVHQRSKNYSQALIDIRGVFTRTGMYKEVQPIGQDLLFVRQDVH
ncbi:protein Star-like [Lingula anatina]|uniref:Protein Star-like n=1 Tax=Lingula anatina TaxID=7574 RepID=A0A1S3HNY4_LINAN|nr:protein Star-like [Lingula anatina]|eukprot:XP_013387740.1 protein Star-like [Lingula anatina]